MEWLLWLIGVALFSHCVGFFGISYFDQTRFAWYALLAIISAATAPRLTTGNVTKRRIEQAQLNHWDVASIPEATLVEVK